jgi:hypothetical protein
MLYKVARFLQLVGLIVLPVAIAGEVAGKLSLKDSLIVSATGGAFFLAGWLLQQGNKPP